MSKIPLAKPLWIFKRVCKYTLLISIFGALCFFLHTKELFIKECRTKVVLLAEDRTIKESTSVNNISPRESLLIDVYEDNLDISELNNTGKSQRQVVIFNRVPKVGSSMIIKLLEVLERRNNFTLRWEEAQKRERVRMEIGEEAALVSTLEVLPTPSVYVKRFAFIDFTKHNSTQPIYINLVRDPVERVISWFYFIRAPWYVIERKLFFPDLPLPQPDWLRKDYESCVLQADTECQYPKGDLSFDDHLRQTLFFCGQSSICLPFNTEEALQRAKQTVDRHYAVVGVLEDLDSTFTVLEHYLPLFFAGAKKVYRDEFNDIERKLNRNHFKPPVSEKVKELVRRNFTQEMDFYLFCRQRLYRQLLALRLSKNPNNGFEISKEKMIRK